ncbi:MAG: response regulator [Opitutales bacterium]|nr:response regulator [Opitutales bacterium]
MSDEVFNLIVVEEDASYVQMLREFIADMPGLNAGWKHCDRLEAAERLLSEETFHLVLLDLHLPDSRGLETLSRLAEGFPHVGILVLSGEEDEELAVRAAEKGAFDYLVKGCLSRESLRKALVYGFRRQQTESRHRKSEALYRQHISAQVVADYRHRAERRILEKIASRGSLQSVLRMIEETFRDASNAVQASLILPEDEPSVYLLEELARISTPELDALTRGHVWTNLAQSPLSHLLLEDKSGEVASAWSFPLRNGEKRVEAFINIFFRERQPSLANARQTVQELAPLIGLALEESSREQELADSYLRFHRLLNEVPNVAVQGYTLDGRVTYWNTASEKLYGFTSDEALGRNLLDLIIPENLLSAVEASLVELRRGGEPPPPGELVLRDRENRPVAVHSSHVILPGKDGAKELFCVDIDLRAHKAAEQRLREQAALLDKATDAIVVYDLDNRILFWNQSAHRLYGWSADEVLGEIVQQKIHADEAAFREAMSTVLTEGEWKGESEHLNREGESLRVEDRWTLVRDERGEPCAILSITTDVTERRLLEQQFLRAQRMESLGTLAGGIAHDLNNLLAPIMMSMDLLNMRLTDPAALELIENVRMNARRGAEMVKQVLSFARGLEGTRMKTQVRHLLREVAKICGDTFPPEIEIRTDLPANLHIINGDPTQIHQVVLNLCVNARDAMPSGGLIRLTGKNVQIDEQFAAMNFDASPGPYVRIDVSDTGTGIAPEILNKIFDPFFTTKAVGKGTGLGLATVLTILKGHGGFVQVESSSGRGTTFSLFFPASSGSADAVCAETPKLPRGNGEWVLVVDDEASVRQITKQTLEAFGYRVLLASDGADGVSAFASRKSDVKVVLADLTMPVMDGLSMIRVVRRLNPEIPIIVASGVSEEERKGEALAAGLDHFIPKPYTANSLLCMIHRVLSA